MANERRETYTREGVEAMKGGLVRAAINRDIWDRTLGKNPKCCYSGNADEGFRVSFDHDETFHDQENEPGYEPRPWMTHHHFPPIPRTRDETKYRTGWQEDYQGNRIAEFDVWGTMGSGFAGLYGGWEARVDQAFELWDEVDQMPYEKDFWEAATRLRDAVKPLGVVNVPGESYYLACRTLGLIAHDPGAQGTTPPERMWAPQINGPIDRFVIPLQGTLLNLYVLGEMLAAQLEGMGNMWQSTRASVMEIGRQATRRMDFRSDGDAVQAVIKSAGWVVGAMGLIPVATAVGIGLAAAGLVLAAADALIDRIEHNSKEVFDIPASIDGATAEEIIRSVEATLDSGQILDLESQVQIDESDSVDLLSVAKSHIETEQAVYDVEAGIYRTCFTMNTSEVLKDSQPANPRNVDIAVECERLRDAGKTFADELGEELLAASQRVHEVYSDNSTWIRPELPGRAIGLTKTGPWDYWRPVRDHLARILDTTGKQVVEVGEYLIAAANYLERADASAKEAMDKAGQELDAAFR
ncbi:hypothetical protein AB0C38_24400 [Amycolatopsis sp. NPDC048633]|uniref:hypothetical protein n=1 Tax=Amycolatopsis sp. NPDC048633 TaxID=3157095 RepID=UPI0033E61BC1